MPYPIIGCIIALYKTVGVICGTSAISLGIVIPKSFNVLTSDHASAVEEPQAVTTIPIGTSNTFSS